MVALTDFNSRKWKLGKPVFKVPYTNIECILKIIAVNRKHNSEYSQKIITKFWNKNKFMMINYLYKKVHFMKFNLYKLPKKLSEN